MRDMSRAAWPGTCGALAVRHIRPLWCLRLAAWAVRPAVNGIGHIAVGRNNLFLRRALLGVLCPFGSLLVSETRRYHYILSKRRSDRDPLRLCIQRTDVSPLISANA